MAAGLGFKTFTTGEVLTAADTNGYLMQGVLVFANAAARDAAITSPQEGQFAYLKDTNVTTYYTGSAWANLDTTGMTNPMTTTGDIIYSSNGSTPARLGIGSTGQVLSVAGGIPSWATPSSSGLVLLSSATFTAVSSFSLATNTFTSTYRNYRLLVNIDTVQTSPSGIFMRMRASGTDNTDASWYGQRFNVPYTGATSLQYSTSGGTSIQVSDAYDKSLTVLEIGNPQTAQRTAITYTQGQGELVQYGTGGAFQIGTNQFDSLTWLMTAGTMTGRYAVYGYAQ